MMYVSKSINPLSLGITGITLPMALTLVLLFGLALIVKKGRTPFRAALKAAFLPALSAPILGIVIFFIEENVALKRGHAFLETLESYNDKHIIVLDEKSPRRAFRIQGTILPWWSLEYRDGMGWFYVI